MKFSIQSLYNWYRETLRHPKYRWWIILGTFVYLLSPLDISPDLFPIVGQIDDVVLVTLLVSEISQMVIESMKSRQPNVSSPEPEAGAGETDKTTVVDVDAVSVK